MSQPNELAALIESSPTHDWLEKAACGDLELDCLDMFFVEAGRTLSKPVAALCSNCEAQAECLAHAFDRDLAGGYFGGLSPSKRKSMGRQAATQGAEPTPPAS